VTDFSGIDTVRGGPGGDTCLATLDDSGGDTIFGGPGVDIWDADMTDAVHTVEDQIQCFAD
jgi:hypothetical protein